MNKQETLTLWHQGPDVWNAWAKELLDRKAIMEREGMWVAHNSDPFGKEEGDNNATINWIEAATADFDAHTFSVANFAEILFPGWANFNCSKFKEDANFTKANFSGNARFRRAVFNEDVHFSEAMFRYADFRRAEFKQFAGFHRATFIENANFRRASFEGNTEFSSVTFGGAVDFTAVDTERGFTLEGAKFADVPDFTQAHFEEAPRLDNVFIPEVGGIARFLLPVLPGIDGSTGISARYRALKRLAIEAHDHTRELNYFTNELKASRGHPDSPLPCPLNLLRHDEHGNRLPSWPGGLRGTMRFWFGLGYEALSNFGRSIALPLFWWVLATAGFAWAYLDRAKFADGCAAGGAAGGETPWSAALGLSIRKALPFAGIASSEKLNQIYACLYGIHGEAADLAELPNRFTPVIPNTVDYLGMVQLVVSILLLFLFLLAVRNHFRIR